MNPRQILALAALLTALLPTWALAAITVDTVGNGEGLTSSSYSHTIAADANFVGVCLAERDTDASGITASSASVTVGGQSATQLTAIQNADNTVRIVLFYKLTPLTGAQTIATTADTGTDRLVTGSISLKGVAQTSTFNTAGSSSNNNSTDADINGLASAVGELAIMCGASATAASSASADATAPVSTEQQDVAHTNATSVRNWIYTEDGAATSIDMRVDLASSVRWSAVAVSLRPIASTFGALRRRGQ